ncbi:secreted phosphoprotein 24 [Prionailurus iriomotensis]
MPILLVLGVNFLSCAGFPVYDYDPSSLREALSASVAKVNAQSLSPYLFRAFRGSIKRVYVLDQDSLSMDLEFGIRETTCRRESGEDPSTCDFQRGYYMPAVVCRSTVRMSAEQVRDVWVRCHWSSSSESNSSEEPDAEIDLDGFWRHIGILYMEKSVPTCVSVLTSLEANAVNGRSSLRRIFPPGNRGYPYKGHRTRTNAGFE